MCTALRVRRHINLLPGGTLFTTRDCLIYGRRAAVDQELYRLVKSGYLLRLARGVFVSSRGNARQFTVVEVARKKASAFGKEIISHAGELVAKPEIQRKGHLGVTFDVRGSTSSFRFGTIRIHFKSIGPRKFSLRETKTGQVLRSLWHSGKMLCSEDSVRKATGHFARFDKDEIYRSKRWIPQWLGDFFPSAPRLIKSNETARWLKLIKQLQQNANSAYRQYDDQVS